MTAINILRQSNAVHMITDGACGGAGWSYAKMIALPHLSAVISCRGPGQLLPLVMLDIAPKFAGFDSLKAGIVASIVESLGSMLQSLGSRGSDGGSCFEVPEFELVVAGLSETRGLEAYFVVSHCRQKEVQPWMIYDVGAVYLSPGDPAMVGDLGLVVDVDTLDPVVDGRRIVEHQRRSTQFVGGFAQLTSIDLTGLITTKVIARWREDSPFPPDAPSHAARRSLLDFTLVNGLVTIQKAHIVNLDADNLVPNAITSVKQNYVSKATTYAKANTQGAGATITEANAVKAIVAQVTMLTIGGGVVLDGNFRCQDLLDSGHDGGRCDIMLMRDGVVLYQRTLSPRVRVMKFPDSSIAYVDQDQVAAATFVDQTAAAGTHVYKLIAAFWNVANGLKGYRFTISSAFIRAAELRR